MADDQCDETTALKSQAASDGDGVRVEAIEMQNRVDAAPPAVEPSPPLHPDAADPGSTSTSRFPILFERSATNSWWNPRFDSDVLEAQHRTTSFPQTRRRFRYALDYVIMSCSAWLTQFVIQRGPSWPAFVGVAATLLVVAIVAQSSVVSAPLMHAANGRNLRRSAVAFFFCHRQKVSPHCAV